jgi:hypothetical protein
MLYSLILSQFHSQGFIELLRVQCTYHAYRLLMVTMIVGLIFPSLTSPIWVRAAKQFDLAAMSQDYKKHHSKKYAVSDSIITLSIGRANCHANYKTLINQ